MALVLQDRVREISTTTGTGTVTLSGAYPGGYRTFASCVPNGSIVYYCIHNTTNNYTDEWEVGYGTYSSNTLTRTNIYSSSNAGAAVNFSAGDKEVFITQPSEQAVFQETDGSLKIINGVIEVSIDGTEGTTLNNATFQAFSTTNGYIQNNIQNLSNGADASSDFVATNDQGSDTQFYADFGINSSGFNSGSLPIYPPNSGYIYSIGDGGANASPFYVGSGDGAVIVHAGGFDTNNTVATFGTDLSTTLEGALDVGSTLNVTGVTTLSALAYTSGNIAAAANNTVLVTKEYVDNATSNGFHVHNPVLVATTGNLTANYNNGTSGVGATLTNSGAQAALSVDGVSMNVNDRVLVWQQTTGTQNGVYVVTTVGSGSTNWVLTRASDADTAGEGDPNSLGGGDYFFVQSGSTLGYHSFVCTNTTTITFGSTAITFSEFSSVPAYTGGTNINVNGQVISLTGTVGPTNGGTGVNTVTTGDVLYGSASNTWSKLAAGSQYKVLTMGASTPEWNALSLSASGAVSGVLPEANGGTNNSSYVTGDTLYASGTNTLGKLSPNTTTTKKFLSQTGTGSAGQAPAWAQPAASDITGLGTMATQDGSNVAITGGNVTLLDTNFTLQDNTDATKQAQFQLSGITTGTTRTYTLPDVSGTLAALNIAQIFTGSTTFSGTTNNVGSGTGTTISSLGYGATTSGNTKTVNIGTNGVAGSTTSITIGSANGTTVNINGTLNASGTNLTALNASNITSGTIGNAYTTASSSNGASTIVARDASGNFTANTITATQINASGAGITSLNASVINSGTIGNAYTTASSSNGASTIVARDASGNFSAATITATTFSGAHSGDGSALTNLNATALSSGTVASARVSGSYTGITGVGTLTAGTWNATAISDTYLSTISTAGKVSNSATTASSSNGASTIVARDASGNFSAGTITANLTGTASNATYATTAGNGGVTSLTGTSNQVTVSASTGAITLSTPQSIGTSSNVQFGSFGVGTAASGTTGEIRATNNVTAYYSDERLKTKVGDIENALDKVKQIQTMYYHANDVAAALGYDPTILEVGVTAQSVQKVMPQTVAPAPIDEKYLTVRYERLVPLLIEAIKELEAQVAELKAK